jgi:squalene-hopene/tetraprenyl-beta-curcumene cyclase
VTSTTSAARFETTLKNTRQTLLDLRHPDGYWEGELSSSALSTATAVCALRLVRDAQAKSRPSATSTNVSPAHPAWPANELELRIRRGLRWLAEHQNTDGGWGDTTQSYSNISTTLLGWAAFSEASQEDAELERRVRGCIERMTGSESGTGVVPPAILARTIRARYGRDQTFSVPILTTLALMGRLGSPTEAWRHVPALPFELAACPRSWFAALKLPVVSYALPALIAIGLVRHRRRPSWNPLLRGLRSLSTRRTLAVLKSIQPTTGGYLEATPLTSFVVLSLVGAGEVDHPVVAQGVHFLCRSVREDGSWPIDTHLATWVTTLAVNALGHAPAFREEFTESKQTQVRQWLLDQQYKTKHPYTDAAPGGWSWTPLSGGVPDADDTPGALLALSLLQANPNPSSESVLRAAEAGVNWLIQLQNGDGGMPTFCKGWGTLPFDRSSPDITAHAVRAWLRWREPLPPAIQHPLHRATQRAIRYLLRVQQASGAWSPLWFGNQDASDESNLTYGTSRVLLAMLAFDAAASGAARNQVDSAAQTDDARRAAATGSVTGSAQPASPGQNQSSHAWEPGTTFNKTSAVHGNAAHNTDRTVQPLSPLTASIVSGLRWLLTAQNGDGGWGGGPGIRSSLEETALAVETLADFVERQGRLTQADQFVTELVPLSLAAIRRGTEWMAESTNAGRSFPTSPIGFYFAKLWYFEKLYPLVYTLAALNRTARIGEHVFVETPLVSMPTS